MKAFIDRVLKKRKQDAEQIKESITTEDKATEAMVESIIEEVKKKEVVSYLKPKHFPDCTCHKCFKWRNENA